MEGDRGVAGRAWLRSIASAKDFLAGEVEVFGGNVAPAVHDAEHHDCPTVHLVERHILTNDQMAEIRQHVVSCRAGERLGREQFEPPRDIHDQLDGSAGIEFCDVVGDGFRSASACGENR